MGHNVELKARAADGGARWERVARSLAGRPHTVERQIDTYYPCPRGRLKLRRRWRADPAAEDAEGRARETPIEPELIAYERPDTGDPASSRYRLIRFDPGEDPGESLALALGVTVEVEKVRTVYLHDRVRIHLDEVRGLGRFLEFEALVLDDVTEADAHGKVLRLREEFGISEELLLSASYRELMLER